MRMTRSPGKPLPVGGERHGTQAAKQSSYGTGSNHLVQESQLDRKTDVESERRLLTVKEAARYLAVSVSTLYGWVWQRRIPFVKIGRALRFDPCDLEAFVEANKQRPRQECSHAESRIHPCYTTSAAGKG